MPDLSTDIRYIRGIGEQRAKSMAKLHITSLRELVGYFPRAYEDRREVKNLAEVDDGDVACVALTVASEPHLSNIRKGLDIIRFDAVDRRTRISITFFNQSYLKNSFKIGEEYIFCGKITRNLLNFAIVNPLFEREDGPQFQTRRIVPKYRLTAGVSQTMIMRAIKQGLEECGEVLPDSLPASVTRAHNLAQARYAYENIHFPESFEALEIARRRLIFEELFVLSCAMKMLRGRSVEKKGLTLAPVDFNEFYAKLPFTLTGAQVRSIEEAARDMMGAKPMSRLVQGDVGSGKTVVAAAMCWFAYKNGYQSALMAPTEILAGQHLATLTTLLEPFGIKTELLTGSLTAKKKREIYARLESGEIDLLIGTHALISDDVKFKSLCLVIPDEQHRFGVEQRAALTAKGEHPHVLVMSATPIPRTLALMIYGDLDISVIDELPPGRQKVETYAVGEKMRQRIYAFIRKQVSFGRQVYVVCPMVEESEAPDGGLKSAKEYAAKLQNEIFPELKIELVHGKMKPKPKDAAMAKFVSGEADILVSTTVIEVGVDVPNASLMVIENADRFGLSQLHQLRGRVGRGEHQSYCVLFEGAGGEVSRQRLKIMCDTTDGFKISEEDLKLRGPGDFFGSRQHGLPEMHIADLNTDINILHAAQQAAAEVIAADPQLETAENFSLREHVLRMLEINAQTLN